jgi:hypothetical protein
MNNEEELLYQAASKGKMKRTCSTPRPPLSLPGVFYRKMKKNCFTEGGLLYLIELLYWKNEENLFYQPSPKGKMKKNCFTQLPLKENTHTHTHQEIHFLSIE